MTDRMPFKIKVVGEALQLKKNHKAYERLEDPSSLLWTDIANDFFREIELTLREEIEGIKSRKQLSTNEVSNDPDVLEVSARYNNLLDRLAARFYNNLRINKYDHLLYPRKKAGRSKGAKTRKQPKYSKRELFKRIDKFIIANSREGTMPTQNQVAEHLRLHDGKALQRLRRQYDDQRDWRTLRREVMKI
jgi:hypothetical protein